MVILINLLKTSLVNIGNDGFSNLEIYEAFGVFWKFIIEIGEFSIDQSAISILRYNMNIWCNY